MQVTSFQKALLGVGAAVGLAGGTAGLLLWRADRKDGEDAAYRGADMPVDTFVDRIMSDYDSGGYVTPFGEYDHGEYEPDGALTIGAEQTPDYDATLHREFEVEHEEDLYDHTRSGQRFLVAADADDDGHVTRAELRAEVQSYAGGDGALSSKERRTVLIDEGLAELVPMDSIKPRTSWDARQDNSDPVLTAGELAGEVFSDLHYSTSAADAIKDGVIQLDLVGPRIPWVDGREQLATGEIRSMLPNLEAIDRGEHGDRDGAVSREELAHWIADEYRSPSLSYGHVRESAYDVSMRLHGQVLGRIDADSLQGHAYLSPKVPAADIERFYGGDLGAFIDASEGVRAARGEVPWKPDPARPENPPGGRAD